MALTDDDWCCWYGRYCMQYCILGLITSHDDASWVTNQASAGLIRRILCAQAPSSNLENNFLCVFVQRKLQGGSIGAPFCAVVETLWTKNR